MKIVFGETTKKQEIKKNSHATIVVVTVRQQRDLLPLACYVGL